MNYQTALDSELDSILYQRMELRESPFLYHLGSLGFAILG